MQIMVMQLVSQTRETNYMFIDIYMYIYIDHYIGQASYTTEGRTRNLCKTLKFHMGFD